MLVLVLASLKGLVDLDLSIMSDEPTNGVTTPTSPKRSGLALTEYTAAPTPPSERAPRVPGLPPNWGIPDAFLLPNGYPDVRTSLPTLLILSCI